MNELTNALVTVAVAIVGVALLAVLVSRNSQTPAVIGSLGSSFAQALGAATSPVTGGGMSLGGNIGGGYQPSYF